MRQVILVMKEENGGQGHELQIESLEFPWDGATFVWLPTEQTMTVFLPKTETVGLGQVYGQWVWDRGEIGQVGCVIQLEKSTQLDVQVGGSEATSGLKIPV